MNKNQLVKSITDQIHKKYPEFSGVKPKVQKISMPNGTISFTFKTSFKTENGNKIHRRLKVVANESGKIIKIADSK